MRQTIPAPETVPVVREAANLVYRQVPGWGQVGSRPLHLTLLRAPAAAQPQPVIVWLCGGAWLDVDHNVWLPELNAFARAGYAVASVQYRLSNVAPFPAPLTDVKAAIRYLRAHAREWGLDPCRFAIMGESAGGFLSALAGATGQTRQFDEGDNLDESSAVQAVVDWYGPTDLAAMTQALLPGRPADALSSPEDLLLGANLACHPEAAQAANPMAYIGDATPPYLILHGTADPLVPIEQSRMLEAALSAAGRDARLYELEGAGHGTPAFSQPAIKDLILGFLQEVL